MHVIQLKFFGILGPPINPPKKEKKKKIKEETTHFGDSILAGKGKKERKRRNHPFCRLNFSRKEGKKKKKQKNKGLN